MVNNVSIMDTVLSGLIREVVFLERSISMDTVEWPQQRGGLFREVSRV